MASPLSLAYNFNGGRHLNRPINANTARGDLLVKELAECGGFRQCRRDSDDQSAIPASPLPVQICLRRHHRNSNRRVRPSSHAEFLPAVRIESVIALAALACRTPRCLPTSTDWDLARNGSKCDNTLPFNSAGGCVVIPFGDMDANYSNGSSIYHGFTANLRKRFGNHYEFLASYSFSHAIDDSTDLQSPLAPQDSYFPNWSAPIPCSISATALYSAVCISPESLAGTGFAKKFFSNWTLAPIVEVASGRPFLIITGDNDNFQFAPTAARPERGARVRRQSAADRWCPQSIHRLRVVPGALLRAADLEHHAALARRQPRSQRGREAVDGFQRHSHRPPHQFQRADQHGPDRGHVQSRQQIQRGRREPALDQRRTADIRLRSAAVSVRDESELVGGKRSLVVGRGQKKIGHGSHGSARIKTFF